MWTDKHKALAAKRFGEFAHLCREDQLAEVMTLAVEIKAKSRTGDAQAAVAWLRSAAMRGAPKAAALPFVDVIDNSLRTLTAKVEELEKRLWSAAHSGGTMTAEELNEVRQEMEMDPPVLPSATGTQDLLDHAIAQGAMVATLQEEKARLTLQVGNLTDANADLHRQIAEIARDRSTLQARVADLERRLEDSMSPPSALAELIMVKAERDAAVADNAALVRWIHKHGHRIGTMLCPYTGGYACQPGCEAHEIHSAPHSGAALLEQHRKEVELLTDLLVGYRKAGRLEHERANAAEAEVERLWCESWGAAAVISLLLEEGVENFRAAQAGAMAVLENPRLTAENERLSHRLMMMTDLRDSYRKGGTMEHVRANLLESEKDGWRMLALRLLVLGVMVRSQWEHYLAAATDAQGLGCPGGKTCHGSMVWCPAHGNVVLLCDMNGRCDTHRNRWFEYTMEHAPVAKFAREEGHEAGRRESSMDARKEVESIQNKLRRARTDAWAEAVDVINGEPLTSQEAREAMAPILVQWVEREQAVHPFLALARDRLASRSYEPIPATACARLLKAFNAVSGEEKHDE